MNYYYSKKEKVKLRSIVAIAAVILIAAIMGGCGKPEPADVLPRLEKAINNQDIEAVIDCFDPESVGVLAGFLGNFIDFDSDEIASMIPFLSEAGSGSDWGEVKLTEIDTEQDSENHATLTYRAEITVKDKDIPSFEGSFPMVLVDDEWYIALW